MDNTPNLQLPYLIAAQAQKHVTHNEALRGLDAIVQLLVLDKDLASPPGSPSARLGPAGRRPLRRLLGGSGCTEGVIGIHLQRGIKPAGQLILVRAGLNS